MPTSVLDPEDRDESDPPGTVDAPQGGGYKHNTRLKVPRAEGGRTSSLSWRGLVKTRIVEILNNFRQQQQKIKPSMWLF